MKLDILAFAAHPDDAELSCSGTLLVEKLNGKKTGIIDLTQGELGTRGTIETRKIEAENSAKILQLDVRENLQMRDGFFKNDEAHQLQIITAIRKYQPTIVLCNAPEDRHPDHGRGADLLQDSIFLAGLRKIVTTDDAGNSLAPWRPTYLFNYIQDRYLAPNFVIDISAVIDKKIASIKAFNTQFYNPDLNEPQTYISTPGFLEGVINRSKMFGKMIGVEHAEGFISKKMIGFSNFDGFVKHHT